MVPPRFQRLVIYGVGLLGGSLGMALKRRGMAGCIVGLGRSMERLDRARQLGALDECHTHLETALAGADALVLAIPPRQIRERLKEIAPLIAPGAFVTDVGSVKTAIVAQGERLLPESCLFVGSHPMAGSEKTGVEHSRSDFYEGSATILTPTAMTPPAAVDLATRFWEALGTRLIIATPQRHDQLLAGISHLPHLTASALMQTLSRHLAAPTELGSLAGGGLRDTTRIAAADPDLWKQIFTENAPNLVQCLDQYIAVLQEWRTLLDKATPDTKALGKACEEGRQARLALPDPPTDGPTSGE